MVYFTDRDKEHSYAYLDGRLVGLVKSWEKLAWSRTDDLHWQANICSSFCDLDHTQNHSYHATKADAQKWIEDTVAQICDREEVREGGE